MLRGFDLELSPSRNQNLSIEAAKKLRAERAIQLKDKKVSGALEFGVAPRLLTWMPNPDEVFPRSHDGYLWTTVHLPGTLDAPEQDLSPQIVEAIKEDPGAALGLFFRAVGVWRRGAFGGDEQGFAQPDPSLLVLGRLFWGTRKSRIRQRLMLILI